MNEYDYSVRKVNKSVLQRILAAIALSEAVVLMFCPESRDGLEALFILPMAFAVCSFVFGEIFWYKGIGIKIYFLISIIRYMVQPALIVLTGGAINRIRMSVVPAHSYRIALIIQVIEILIAFWTIHTCYNKILNRYALSYEKIEDCNRDSKLYTIGIRAGAWIIIFFFVILLIQRISLWLPALNIFGLKSGIMGNNGPIDKTLFNVVKTALFIASLHATIKLKGSDRQWVAGALLVFTTFLCIFSYLGTNRSGILEMALTCFMLIIYYLPEYKKPILVITVPLFSVGFIGMSVAKTFGNEATTIVTNGGVSLQHISNLIEEYTNGPWCVAQSFQASIGLSFIERYQACIKGIVDGFGSASILPGFSHLTNITQNWNSAADIMKYSFQEFNRGQMLSFSGGIFINYGVIGWIMMPLITHFIMRLLVYFNVKYNCEHKVILKKFIWVWCAILFSLTHCYCMQTLIYSLLQFILFLLPLLWGNKFIIGKRGD